MLMALVLETPYKRHWHSKVVQLGLLRLSPLTVGLIWISQHGYRRRRVFLLIKWNMVSALLLSLGIQTGSTMQNLLFLHWLSWCWQRPHPNNVFSPTVSKWISKGEYVKSGPVIVHSGSFLGSTDGKLSFQSNILMSQVRSQRATQISSSSELRTLAPSRVLMSAQRGGVLCR